MFGPIKKSIRNFLEAQVRAQKKFEWDDAPRLDLSSVPEEESKDASLLALHLWMLASYVLQFWHAIRLMDHCEDLDDEAIDRFNAQFPYAKEVRDAAGHFADRMFKPADIDEHSHSDGGILVGTVWHRALMFSHKGKVVGLDINEKNFERLLGLKREVYAAFKKVPMRTLRDVGQETTGAAERASVQE